MKTFASVVKHALAVGTALALAAGAAAAQELRAEPASAVEGAPWVR